MKDFVFLYPIPKYVDFEIYNWKENKGLSAYRKKYSTLINECIRLRYREKGYKINYVIFDDCNVSPIFKVLQGDNIIKIGLDLKKYGKKQSDGSFIQADFNYVLDQIKRVKIIRIAGFHKWDCVQELARVAYNRGLDTLVDEDLTDDFSNRITTSDFKVGKFIPYVPKNGWINKMAIEHRENKPWLLSF